MATTTIKTSTALKRTLPTAINSSAVAIKLLTSNSEIKQDTGLKLVNAAAKQAVTAEQMQARVAALNTTGKLTDVITTGTASDINTQVAIEKQKEDLQKETEADETAAVAVQSLTGNQLERTKSKGQEIKSDSDADGTAAAEDETTDETVSTDVEKSVETTKNLLDKAIAWVKDNEKLVIVVIVLIVVVYIVKK